MNIKKVNGISRFGKRDCFKNGNEIKKKNTATRDCSKYLFLLKCLKILKTINIENILIKSLACQNPLPNTLKKIPSKINKKGMWS